MKEGETISFEEGAVGASFAAFLISINTIVVLSKKGVLNEQDALEIVGRARTVIANQQFPDGGASIATAKQILDLALPLFHAATASKSPSGSH